MIKQYNLKTPIYAILWDGSKEAQEAIATFTTVKGVDKKGVLTFVNSVGEVPVVKGQYVVKDPKDGVHHPMDAEKFEAFYVEVNQPKDKDGTAPAQNTPAPTDGENPNPTETAYAPRSCRVVFDFDGVIHSYSSEYKGPAIIPDAPVDGIKEAIVEIHKEFKVAVTSTRCSTREGKEAIAKYLEAHGIPFDEISSVKLPAVAYVDDRALKFDGNPKALLAAIKGFKTWQGK
jgi:hypothetical protein